jgi:hypothetical protein
MALQNLFGALALDATAAATNTAIGTLQTQITARLGDTNSGAAATGDGNINAVLKGARDYLLVQKGQGDTALAKLLENSTVLANVQTILGTSGIVFATGQKVTLQQAGADLSATNRAFVENSRSQNTVTMSKVTLVAATARSLMAADALRTGGRILNWTASVAYFVKGTSGTPASGSPSAYVAAATTLNGATIPGEYIFDYRPVDAYQVVGASAGDLTVELW